MSFILNPFVMGTSLNPLLLGLSQPCILDLQADAGLSLADGASVASWGDQSGNSYAVTQATGSAKPTFRATGGPSSRPSVEFDGGDSLGISPTIAPSAYTIFCVCKPSDSNPRTIIAGATNTSPQGLQYRLNSLKQDLLKTNVALIGSSSTSLSTSAYQQINATWNNVSAYAFRLGGSADGSGTNAQTVGGLLAVGVRGGLLNENFLGHICMITVYGGVLSGPEISSVEAAILARWGV